MRAEPTDREKVLEFQTVEELEGARMGFEFEKRLTPELDNLITLRIAQIRRKT